MSPILVSLVTACSTPSVEVPQAVSAPVQPAVAAPAAPAVDEELLARIDALERQFDDLDMKVSQLQVVVADIENVGIGRAETVRYDPSRSLLDARDVQSAIDEIATDWATLQRNMVDMGGVGAGLFEVPDDDEGPGGEQATGGMGHNPGPGFGLPSGNEGGAPAPGGQGAGGPAPSGGGGPGGPGGPGGQPPG